MHDPDDKYLKNIKLMFLLLTIIRTLNSSCNGFDTWTNISQGTIFLKLEKVKFAAMKLTGQVSQYWTNVESIKASRCQDPKET